MNDAVLDRLLAGLALAALLGLGAESAAAGALLVRGWPGWRAAAGEDLAAALEARAGAAPPRQREHRGRSAAAGSPTAQGRDPSCASLADALARLGERLAARQVVDPVPAAEREAAVGSSGCSPADPAIRALFDRYSAAFDAAGMQPPAGLVPR